MCERNGAHSSNVSLPSIISVAPLSTLTTLLFNSNSRSITMDEKTRSACKMPRAYGRKQNFANFEHHYGRSSPTSSNVYNSNKSNLTQTNSLLINMKRSFSS